MNVSKIIKGAVSNGRYTVTAPIVKEDYGLYLQIEGVELPETYQVDFSNSENSGTSVTMIGNADGVLIPRQFISTGKDVFAFLYHVGEDYGRTVYKFRIPNKLRPDRTNEEPTPEEQSVIDQILFALNEAVDRAEDAEQAIEDMSVSATTLAEGSSATVTKTESDGVVHLTFGIPKGQTGDTPTITASKTGKTTSIYVDGSEVAQIEDGTDGIDGDDGYSPTANVSKTGKTATITITDKTGTTSAQVEDGTDGTDGVSPTVTITPITGGHRIAITDADGTEMADVMDGDDYILTEEDKEEIADMVEVPSDWLKAFPTDTASGSIASFSDGADDLPLKSLVVDINPVQDTSGGDPSPENICPISGWTQVGVEQRGKNLFPFGAEVIAVWNKSFVQSEPMIRKGQTVTLSADAEWGGGYTSSVVFFLRSNSSGIATVYFDATRRGGTWTATEDVYGFNFYATSSGATNPGVTTIYRNIQLEFGSTATSYEPYTGRSITIDLGQTVYGGKLDVLTGELTVYPYYASYNGETLTGEWISDRDKYVAGTTPTIGAQVVNIGAQGVTVQLEPHEVESLHGVNNIWADSGDTEVEYRADTKLYIERLTAPDSEDMIADANITSGKYFMVGNNLYKATANIANGSAIIVGTNCIRKSLSEALNEINA